MLETRRLVLRQWRDADHDEFIALNSDARVMEYFPSLYSEDETLHFIEFCRQMIEQRGWGFWAVELKATAEFIGMVGLNEVPFQLPGMKSGDRRVEVGWRLSHRFWGSGYAPEAATASIDYAIRKLNEPDVCAFTPVQNQRSRRVMEKIHMRDAGTPFRHPRFQADHELAEHVLYKIGKIDFLKTREWM